MQTGFLVLLNITMIPFICEAEAAIEANGKFPRFSQIIRLEIVRKSRWIKIYYLLFLIFLALAISPTRSGKIYYASETTIAITVIIQIGLWLLLVRKSKNLNNQKSGNEK